MRAELTRNGFNELKDSESVSKAFDEMKGTALLVVNSVCGCAAGAARPGVLHSLSESEKRPEHLLTVFAGQDGDATSKAREYLLPYPPSSPSIALFRDGELVHFIERHHIEGRSAEMISNHLLEVYKEFC
jgi:putative YphP/YqiW family bacilliredoxin